MSVMIRGNGFERFHFEFERLGWRKYGGEGELIRSIVAVEKFEYFD